VGDLAAAGIDRGHLATIVRDAMLKHNVDPERLAAALARYARRYGMGTGDGRGLVSVMLKEAGVPRSAVDVAARADTATLAAAMSSEAWRSIIPRLDPEVLRSIIPRLDPEVLRVIVADNLPKVDLRQHSQIVAPAIRDLTKNLRPFSAESQRRSPLERQLDNNGEDERG
jgi:hypothetical protein